MTTPHQQSRTERPASIASLWSWDSSWGFALFSFGVSFLVFLIVFRDPIGEAVWLWSNRSTYNHCFLIIPITLFLLWEERHTLLAQTPAPSFLGMGIVVLFLIVWLFAATANISEGEHIALLGILQGLILATLGAEIYKRHWLAFTYLWLLVPTGEFIIPILRDLAAIQSEWWLNLAQIPVYLEDYILETPTGRYFVADGCAGLNFFLTAIALTPIYGMMMYRSWTKRFIAIGIMLAIAVIANAIRIFLIIALAEFSDKQIDIVDDHIVYGWGFFAIILLIMGYIGYRFADDFDAVAPPANPAFEKDSQRPTRLVIGIVTLVLMLSASAYSASLHRPVLEGSLNLAWPDQHQEWLRQDILPEWQLRSPQADLQTIATYASQNPTSEGNVIVAVGYFWRQDKDHELLGGNHAFDQQGVWITKKQNPFHTMINGQPFLVVETILQGRQGERVVWHTYWIGNDYTTKTLSGKIKQVLATWTGGETRSAILAISTDAYDDRGYARDRLRAFLSSEFPLKRLLQNVTINPVATEASQN